MGASDAVFHPGTGERLVAFDFDGTLTCRDSFMAFLRWRAGPVGFALGLVRLVPATARYLVDRDRGRLKAAAAQVFLRGLTTEQLSASAEAYALAASARLLRPDAVRRWREWIESDARVVIVTASPELTVAPFAKALGAHALIGTRLSVDGQGRLTGGFDGANCRGAEKVSRLEAMFGAGVRLAAAYGDTGGDREMLGIAEEAGYQVFTEQP